MEVAESVRLRWDSAFNDSTKPLGPYIPTGVRYVEATCAEIMNLTTGKLKAAAHSVWPTPMAGTSSVQSLPLQIAVAVSLWAGVRDNGSRVKGRFFLPPFHTNAVNSDGTMTGTSQQRTLDVCDLFLAMLITDGHTPCVWSRSIGALQPVTLVRVGSQFDTIRSRRNAGVETYVSSDV